ncbi:hypothetical protein BJ912DRAFT_921464 [Pholiota molesta]|nr:hypothetical protein BJ912DRAFT_921464 [Pholiota molesta]
MIDKKHSEERDGWKHHAIPKNTKKESKLHAEKWRTEKRRLWVVARKERMGLQMVDTTFQPCFPTYTESTEEALCPVQSGLLPIFGKTETETSPGWSQDCKRPIKTDIDRFTLVFGGSATDKNRSQPVLAKTG